MKIVTFDFDNTLSRESVQEYALRLINGGVDVWILTSRYDDLNINKYGYRGVNNNDLYSVASKLGIPKWKIRFTCMRDKSEYLYGTNVIWHLDDDFTELNKINRETETVGVSVNSSIYQNKCNKLLGLN